MSKHQSHMITKSSKEARNKGKSFFADLHFFSLQHIFAFEILNINFNELLPVNQFLSFSLFVFVFF